MDTREALDRMFAAPVMEAEHELTLTLQAVRGGRANRAVRYNGKQWHQETLLTPVVKVPDSDSVETDFAKSFYNELYSYPGIRQAGATVLITDRGGPVGRLADVAADREPTVFPTPNLKPREYEADVQVGRDLFRDSSVNTEAFIGSMLGRSLGATLEEAYSQGRGQSFAEPDGWDNQFLAPARAYQTVDVPSTDLIKETDLRKVQELLRAKSKAGFAWLMTVKVARRLPPSAYDKQSNRLLGHPVHVVVPRWLKSDRRETVMFGDMSKYYIADAACATIRRSVADNGEVKFSVSWRTDGRFYREKSIAWMSMHVSGMAKPGPVDDRFDQVLQWRRLTTAAHAGG